MMVYQTRWDFIEPYVQGRRVLDVGATELVGTVHWRKKERWLHGKIAQVASRVVGLDKNCEQVDALRHEGYDIRQGNAESFELGERFEVIVAGELIEHLSNPGDFLDCVKRHLTLRGFLILTTPNRFNALAFLKAARRNRIPTYDKPIDKHVLYFDEDALRNLLLRHGLIPMDIAYYESVGSPPRDAKTRLLMTLLRRYRPVLLPGLLMAASMAPLRP